MTFTPVRAPEFFKRRKASESGCKYSIFSLQKWDVSESTFAFSCIHLLSLLKKLRSKALRC